MSDSPPHPRHAASTDPFDVLVVGGGLVGCALVCALSGSGLRLAQVEAVSSHSAAPPSFDERKLALSAGSLNALAALGVLERLESPPAPIRHIHVSRRGDFGVVRLDAARWRRDAFGGVVVARALGNALEARVAALPDLQRWCPARVVAIHPEADGWRVEVQAGEAVQVLRTRLLVAADGSESPMRAALGIAAQATDYGQTLFLAAVAAERAPPDTAWERFTGDGPVALLPLGGGVLGSVLSVPAARADAVAALDDAGYAALLQARFGWRAGRLLRVGRRSAYPIRMRLAERLVAPRAVLVGNAAQTLHPVGAQGFNLGLRDALTLAETLREPDGGAQPRDPGDAARLARYAQRRAPDRARTVAMSDGLVRVFGNDFAPLRLLRSAALVATDRVPGLAGGLVADAMGLGPDVPALMLGDAA